MFEEAPSGFCAVAYQISRGDATAPGLQLLSIDITSLSKDSVCIGGHLGVLHRVYYHIEHDFCQT